MRNFLALPWGWYIPGEPRESLEESCRRNPSPEAPYAAALLLQKMSPEEKEKLALRYCTEFVYSLRRLGLRPESEKFAEAFTAARRSKRAVREADAAMWQRMADWDGVWKRTTASLPPERRNVLATKGGVIVMDFYASYLLTHYVAQNDRCDAETRRIARSVVSLFKLHADGAVGYRGAGG